MVQWWRRQWRRSWSKWIRHRGAKQQWRLGRRYCYSDLNINCPIQKSENSDFGHFWEATSQLCPRLIFEKDSLDLRHCTKTSYPFTSQWLDQWCASYHRILSQNGHSIASENYDCSRASSLNYPTVYHESYLGSAFGLRVLTSRAIIANHEIIFHLW